LARVVGDDGADVLKIPLGYREALLVERHARVLDRQREAEQLGLEGVAVGAVDVGRGQLSRQLVVGRLGGPAALPGVHHLGLGLRLQDHMEGLVQFGCAALGVFDGRDGFEAVSEVERDAEPGGGVYRDRRAVRRKMDMDCLVEKSPGLPKSELVTTGQNFLSEA
jgi:hypothetical protein